MPATNLILITADELRGDCLSCMGNPDLATPALDAFAAAGVRFADHFTVHGKCVPSRIALATGRYCHSDGIRAINEENLLPSGSPDVLSRLKASGFQTAVFGHNHVWEDFWGDNTPSSSLVDWHSYTKDVFAPLLDTVAPAPPTTRIIPDLSSGFDYHGVVAKPRGGFSDANRCTQAVHFLRTIRDRQRPFMMQLNLGAPHPPYQVEEPWFSRHDRDMINAFPHDLPSNAPLPLRAMRRLRTGNDASAASLREIQATYYGMIAQLDDQLSRVFDAIGDEGLWQNTMVIFTSDHGDFASQYGLIEKWDTAMNDCILHVPLLIRAPGLPVGKVVTGLSEHVDIAATCLETLGIDIPAAWVMHGRSLLHHIHGAPGKAAVFADGGHEAAMRARFNSEPYRLDPHTGARVLTTAGKQLVYQCEPDAMARTKMVRTERWKLVVRETGDDELYNVVDDPWELCNRIHEPGHETVVRDLQRRLLDWCLRSDPDRPFLAKVGA